jgi:putative flippase GtrA
MNARVGPFIAVGALGFALQMVVLAVLTDAGWPLVVATATAVEVAILHNFCWHESWTWRARAGDDHWLRRLARFHASTAVTSIGANVIITTTLVEFSRVPPVVASSLAVALMSAVNFFIADRWVFARRAPLVMALVAACAVAPRPAHAAPPNDTVLAWNAYVAGHEARIERDESTPCSPDGKPSGESLGVPGGTIHRWTGCTLVPGTSVGAIVDGLMHPGTPPPQEDVVASRVLSRQGDGLRVYLRIVRRTILTVTYDTEHDVTFSRPRPDLATSRSIATRIVESAEPAEPGASAASAPSGEPSRAGETGRDRGFLWKLNSYWRYIQTDRGVRVELESISLSRDVPMLLKPIASPIITRVARESITRALDAIRARFAVPRQSS